MNQRFQSSESLLGLLESGIFLTFLLLIVVVGCDSKETAVSDYPSGATSSQQDQDVIDLPPPLTNNTTRPQQSSETQQAIMSGEPSTTPPAMEPEDQVKVAPLPLQFQGPDATARELKIDPERLTANGIRTLSGKNLILHTDIPLDEELRRWPVVFEKAVEQLCDYFDVDVDEVDQWQVRACVIQDMNKFKNAGLLPQALPEFQHGYALGDRIFLKEQPSQYYRRHLLIHEGVHSFMLHFFQGAGPPWYMEGMAEMLATHELVGQQVHLRSFPADRTAVPFWGRVKIIKDDVAVRKGKMIEEVMQYGSNAHLNVEAYGWSWAATTFLDRHPDFQTTFRRQIEKAGDSSPQFSLDLVEAYGDQWLRVRQQWQLFIMNMEYGYDIVREAIDDVEVRPYAQLPEEQTIQVQAGRGWQSTGLAVTKGMNIQLTASGRFIIHQEKDKAGQDVEKWESEPSGITIQYYKGNPLGKLLIAVDNLNQTGLTGLVSYAAIGGGGEMEIPYDGVLYLRVNDSPAELHDNRGEIEVKLSLMEGN